MVARTDPVNAGTQSQASTGAGLTAQNIIDYATQPSFLKTPYIDHSTIPSWGPGKGWDCSSYTSFILSKFGVTVPASSDAQYNGGTAVGRDALQVGDLVFYHNPNAGNPKTGHVAIYVGNGKVANALNGKAGTVISNIDAPGPYAGARRYLSVAGSGKTPAATPGSHGVPQGDSQNVTIDANGTAVATANPDTLDRDQLAKYYGYAYDIITRNPDLFDLWKRATAGDGNWSAERFQSQVRNTNWYKNNAESARLAWVGETAGGKDWTDQLKAATDAVSKRATDLGFHVAPADLAGLARDYIYNGWGTSAARATELDKALSGQKVAAGAAQHVGQHTYTTTGDGGVFGETAQQLRGLAEKNGIGYDQSWFDAAARSVAGGLTTQQDWENDIRDKAASLFPVFADKIKAGMNARELASPWVTRMANVLELDPASIDLNDPAIKNAMGGIDEKGNPVATGLWDFEKKLMQDKRWQYTKGASDRADGLISKIGSMMGFSA